MSKHSLPAILKRASTAPRAWVLLVVLVVLAGVALSASGIEAQTADGAFTPAGEMTTARANHTAVLLQDGAVLIVGYATTAEVFDPATGTFTAVGNNEFGGQSVTAQCFRTAPC